MSHTYEYPTVIEVLPDDGECTDGLPVEEHRACIEYFGTCPACFATSYGDE